MSTSQNGWGVLTTAPAGKLPWITGRVRPGDVYEVFDYLCSRFNAEVEPIVVGHSWGWANRAIRGSSTTSNHASGTAIDLNAPAHPLGRAGTFSKSQVAAIRRILSALGGAVRWGGDYSGRKDEMHFEIIVSASRLRQVAASIRAGDKLASRPSTPTYTEVTGSTPLVKLYHKGVPVRRIQAVVGVSVDGYYGPDTETAVKAYQKRYGLTVDGIVGAKTWARINTKPAPAPVSAAPPFPWPAGHWIGQESNNPRNHSGALAKDRPGIKVWQKQMLKRGWSGIGKADGYYGPRSEKVARQFQREKNLTVDGYVGRKTWDAAWDAPVT